MDDPNGEDGDGGDEQQLTKYQQRVDQLLFLVEHASDIYRPPQLRALVSRS